MPQPPYTRLITEDVFLAFPGSALFREAVQDAAAALLTNGAHTGIRFTYNDAENALGAEVTVTGGSGGGVDPEAVRDTIAAALRGTGITISSDDDGDTITLTAAVRSVAGRTGDVTLAASDVGLGNVDNTSDAQKPISTAQATALGQKAPLESPAFTGTPTGITKAHVGLPNVDNTSDATKPVSAAQQTAINARVSQAAYDADKAALATSLAGKQSVGDYATQTELDAVAAAGFDITQVIEYDDADLESKVTASQTARGYALVVGPPVDDTF